MKRALLSTLWLAAAVLAPSLAAGAAGATGGPGTASEPGVILAGGAAAVDSAAARITAGRLLADVAFLASPACEGRQPGTPGYERAAAFVEARLRELGLAPGGEDGYRQHLPIESNQITAARLALAAPGAAGTGAEGTGAAGQDAAGTGAAETGGEVREYRLGPDFVCRGLTGAGRVTAPVVFAGYGLARPDLGYDDYAGIDVRGRAVLAFKTPPSWSPAGGGWGDDHLPRPKAAAAAARGAVALLLVAAPDSSLPPWASRPIGSFLEGPGARLDGFPSLQVSPEVAAELLAGGGATLPELWAAIEAARAPRSRALAAAVTIEVASDYRPAADGFNLVGVLPGADPALAGEAVVIGAHLDHVGRQGPDLVFPGANDNASGAAAVLALAEALAQPPRRPARTVVFVLFTGEEHGLNGARWHAAHPVAPLARTVAMLNLDCVACGDSLQLGNGHSVPNLWRLARDLDAAGDRITVERTWAGGGADATPFHESGVPSLYLATTRGYEQLHMSSDLPATLNGPLYERVVRLALRIAAAVAGGGYAREEPAHGP